MFIIDWVYLKLTIYLQFNKFFKNLFICIFVVIGLGVGLIAGEPL